MKTLLVAAALIAIQCGTPKPAPTPTGSTCADACATLTKLGCEEAKPTDAGATCVEVCTDAGLPLDCIAHAASCEAASACE